MQLTLLNRFNELASELAVSVGAHPGYENIFNTKQLQFILKLCGSITIISILDDEFQVV